MARIAIADDHGFFRSGLAAALGAMGHDVVASVASGEEALDAVNKLAPELLLLDVQMQTVNRVEVLRSLREAKNRIPVIMLTADLANNDLIDLSIGVQSGPPIGAQKGPLCRCADRLMLGACFALLAT